MIELLRNNHSALPDFRIKILGLGGAGSNALDRIQLDGAAHAELVALNTDVQSLMGSVAPLKVQLGPTTTRGLGAGGDPEVGYTAADEAADEIRAAVDGASMVLLCVGLGGGTGSGAASIVASIAREQGALVVVFATLPFSFEGKRRIAQAHEALAGLQHYADTVICFENDKMADVVSPRATIQEAFTAADRTISESVRAIMALTQQRGLIHIGFDELATALRSQNARCIFGYGEADGDTRAHTALERALKNPLIGRGRMLTEAANVLVNIVGGPSMTLNEVQLLMEEFNKHIGDETRILFGTAIDRKLGERLTVTILSSLAAESSMRIAPLAVGPRSESAAQATVEAEPELLPEPRIAYVETDEEIVAAPAAVVPQAAASVVAPRSVAQSAPAIPAPERVTAPSRRSSAASPPRAKATTAPEVKREARQEQMQFEPVTRGRFEKSEPTIVDGQDLDVPTFLRRNIKAR
jgi:cell division protein FtsZ